MLSPLDGVKCVFQPSFSLRTGKMISVAAQVIPPTGTMYDMLRAARRKDQLTSTDIALAALAATRFSVLDGSPPVHVNLLAITVEREVNVASLLEDELQPAGLAPEQIVLELRPPFSGIDKRSLIRGVELLRDRGYGIGVADLGDGDVPFTLLTHLKPDVAKIDSVLVAGLGDDPARSACVEALALLCERIGTRLIAEGVTNTWQLVMLKKLDVHAAQGDLLAPCTPQTPPPDLAIGSMLESVRGVGQGTTHTSPQLTACDLAHTAVTLTETATAEDVRQRFSAHPDASCVVLLDAAGQAIGLVERNRFLMAVAGAYGHALYAKREAKHLADTPRTVLERATAVELLELIATAPRHRNHDDLVVVDGAGRCVGIVGVADAMRAMAELEVEHAARLHPLTGLPGTEVIAHDVQQCLQRQQSFSISWLDIDQFKVVNDTLGVAAGDQLIKLVGAALRTASMNRPGATIAHVGGDDFLLVAELDDVLPLVATVLDTQLQVEQICPSVSVATLVCTSQSIHSYQQASALLAPLKRTAKQLSGTAWVVGRPGTERVDILRGTHRNSSPPNTVASRH